MAKSSCFIFLAFLVFSIPSICADYNSPAFLAAKDYFCLKSIAESQQSDFASPAGIDRMRICRSFDNPGYFLTIALINPKSEKNYAAPDYYIVSDPVLLYLERKEKSPPLQPRTTRF